MCVIFTPILLVYLQQVAIVDRVGFEPTMSNYFISLDTTPITLLSICDYSILGMFRHFTWEDDLSFVPTRRRFVS